MFKRLMSVRVQLGLSDVLDFPPSMPVPRRMNVALVGALLVVAAVGSMCSGNVFAEDLVIGVSAKWVRGVENRVPGKVHDGSSPSAPLYFWMRYEGNQAALKYIRERGGLPIRHKWLVTIGGIVAPEQPDQVVTEMTMVPLLGDPGQQRVYTEMTKVSLSIGTDEHLVLHALEGRLKSLGAFNWRTWSMKKNVSKGRWQVEVVYEDDGRPVNCKDQDQIRPCIYFIDVR